MMSSKILDALAGLIAAWGLMLLMTLFSVLVKVLMVAYIMLQFGHAYAINDNGIDPNTGVPYANEAIK